LYVVYSRIGADRKHHPEVCLREVGGAPEVAAARQILYVDAARQRSVQRFQFRTGVARLVTVYYWHYTFPRIPPEGQSLLQQLHQRLGRWPPSITVQVATTGGARQRAVVEETFLPAVDAALRQGVLPANARMACDRLPIRAVRE
jgi:hypothetical protein